jgi:hypothetical protein
MALRFVLNSGQLDFDYLTTPNTLVLDSDSRGILDSAVFPNSSPIVVNEVATSLFNNLSVSATASVTNPQTAQASFGAITSIASADIAHSAQGATNLGSLESLVQTVITKTALAQSLFSSLLAQVEININVESSAQSLFGELQSSANLGVALQAFAESNFGGLSASGTATGGEPPAPPEPQYGSRGPYQRKVKPKLEPLFEPEIPVIIETKKPIKILMLKPDTVSSNFNASAQNRIDFSIVQDEADLLLIL